MADANFYLFGALGKNSRRASAQGGTPDVA